MTPAMIWSVRTGIILAEVKNKHNTMNASNRIKVVDDLDTAIRQKGRGWTGYLVIIIPKMPRRYRKKLTTREIYEIDGASFYELVTRYPTALHDLYFSVERVMKEHSPDAENGDIFEYCKNVLRKGIPE